MSRVTALQETHSHTSPLFLSAPVFILGKQLVIGFPNSLLIAPNSASVKRSLHAFTVNASVLFNVLKRCRFWSERFLVFMSGIAAVLRLEWAPRLGGLTAAEHQGDHAYRLQSQSLNRVPVQNSMTGLGFLMWVAV